MEKKQKVDVIIQARYTSTRLRGKVLKKFLGKTVLQIIHDRLKLSKNVNKIIVACSTSQQDLKIVNLCKKLKINYFVGSENDVLDRFFKCANHYNLKHIARITADCPLVDYKVFDKITKIYFRNKVDYASNVCPETFPDGLDIEIFSKDTLDKLKKLVKDKYNKEHVTSFIHNDNLFTKYNFKYLNDYSFLRLTLDYEQDYKLLNYIFNYFKNIYFDFEDILQLYKKYKSIFSINRIFSRNENSFKNSGQKLWSEAKKIIPGGVSLFSKNPDLFLPKSWPVYFNKTKGCHIYDLDNNKFLDLSLMGVGTNILGYSNSEVDNVVQKVVKNGNMSTLNCPEEVMLAKELIKIHPWAEMAKFTRSGGEAVSVAVRYARTFVKNQNIAICGYHGWHDWYLSANLSNENNLNNHLMKNVPISGVFKKLKNSTYSFEYNDINSLKKILKTRKIGVIVMEVSRSVKPDLNFLREIRKICDKNKIVLIYDECTSGFRESMGGLHMKYKIFPDIMTLGKALGNGYSICAVIGKRMIMGDGSKTFVSSTFWSERIGPAAALKTLEIMKRKKTWITISSLGKWVKKNWIKLAKKHKLRIYIDGLDALPRFSFKNNHLKYKTFITQEFLKKNILASNTIYLSICHNKKLLNKYFFLLNKIFKQISLFEKNILNVDNYLQNPVCIQNLREKRK